MSFQTMKLAVAAVGVAIWVYGYSSDNTRIRWIGIAVLAVSLLMRFFRPRKPTSPAQG
ncbi:MAG TPA: hypothetical protein VM166_12540 [Gemmatimonadaceae bacterium]|nr:hypothetical protein [Gemmatimonadaceae bacterium]